MSQPNSKPSPADLTASLIADEFWSGDPFALRLLQAEAEHLRVPNGQALFHQGDPGDSLYLLMRGRLGVRLRHADGSETVIDELERGAIVGEMALLTGQARSATVYALADAELVRCSKEGYERLAEEHPQELAGFIKTITHRLERIQLASVLEGLLGDIGTVALHDLQAELEWQELSHGEPLFHQGDPSDAMYIVISGRLRVLVTGVDGNERVVGEVAAGETVGELGLITGEPRTATVYAIRDTNVVKLTQTPFVRLLERYPQAMMQITRTIISRLRGLLRVSPERYSRALTLALVPASETVPLEEFAQRLAKSLEAFGPVLHLDSVRFDRMYGKAGAAQTPTDDPRRLVLAAWMSQQETKYRTILYVADPSWSPWTERCVCEGDRVLIVGLAHGDPMPGATESALEAVGVAARKELVLLHPADTDRPKGTASWLAQRQVRVHHHVRMKHDVHYQRLARRLTGRAVGLVLSGGGARAFAHLGVFRALEELGIHIDLVGGTSMGSLMAAMYAMERSYAEGLRLTQESANPKHLFDYTLPLTSLMASRKVTNVVKRLCGDSYIEDLWRPFFCVSVNVSRAEQVVHQTGLLWKGVRASCALPGVFTPLLREGELLMDGGLINNFPVDLMRELFEAGTVIGVNVSLPKERAEDYEFGASISGWEVLWSRINPFVKPLRVPSLADSLARALEVRGAYLIQTRQVLADLLIQPDVRQYATLEFGSYEPIIEAGYRMARERLAGWQGVTGNGAAVGLRRQWQGS
jgi:predicted acylesterase/phospholipase RssA/CRP-like cAMP-binding protein